MAPEGLCRLGAVLGAGEAAGSGSVEADGAASWGTSSDGGMLAGLGSI